MTEFEKQFREVKELLDFKDYNQVIKRIIDFTLDSEDITLYQKTNAFLDWHDNNENNEIEKLSQLSNLLTELHSFFEFKRMSRPSNDYFG